MFTTAATQGDLDKVLRSTMDGLAVKTGGCIAQDDSQFVRLKMVEKRYVTETEGPGALIQVEHVEPFGLFVHPCCRDWAELII